LLGSGLFTLKNSALKGVWGLARTPIPITRDVATGFIRAVNQVQVVSFYDQGRHATREEFLGANGVLAHREHFKPGELGYAWMSNLNVFSDEVLPRWKMDFALTNESTTLDTGEGRVTLNTGYRLILVGEDEVIITDHRGVIYLADKTSYLPSAKELPSAKDYPGALGLSKYVTPKRSILESVANFLTPVAYAKPFCHTCCDNQTCCTACGICPCVQNCAHCACVEFVPPGRCFWNTGGNCAPPCAFQLAGCGGTQCNCCAKFLGGCCMVTAGCTAGCPPCP
jgi:hypothetical protein